MKVIMSKSQYAKTHRDFKGVVHGVKTIMRANGGHGSCLIAVEFDDGGPLRQGRKVICNGYEGAIVRRYDGAMVEVRLSSGIVCVDIGDLIFLED